ncbi:MAG: hypothetical protein ACLVJ6_10385 [Merdibacter sp.]
MKKIYEQGATASRWPAAVRPVMAKSRCACSSGCGSVETMAHYEAAKYFNPDVDYILTSAVRTLGVSRSAMAASMISSSTRRAPAAAVRSSRHLRRA